MWRNAASGDHSSAACDVAMPEPQSIRAVFDAPAPGEFRPTEFNLDAIRPIHKPVESARVPAVNVATITRHRSFVVEVSEPMVGVGFHWNNAR